MTGLPEENLLKTLPASITPEKLAALVAAADDAAVANVRAGRGGPFGALLFMGDMQSGDLTQIGEPACNAVLSTGLPGAHAEDQVLDAPHVKDLEDTLKDKGAANSFVILASSAESCPACHAKVEIFCRRLVHDGLLEPGRFFLAYGATYDDTFHVAGFNDAPYLKDLSKAPEDRLVCICPAACADIPAPVTDHMQDGHAAIALTDGRIFTGADARDAHFTLTAEVSAIYAACRAQREDGAAEPWDLNGATLYSHTNAPGPLAYTTCQWANVTRWVTLKDGAAGREAPGISNENLFKLIAERPYNGTGTAVQIIHVGQFANKAQKLWQSEITREDSGLVNYNGIKGYN